METMLEALIQSMADVKGTVSNLATRLNELEQRTERSAATEPSASEKTPKNRDSAETAISSPVEAWKQNTSPAQYDHSFFTAPSSPERFSTPTSVKLTHATVPGQVTIIRGTTTDYNKKLKSITDLFTLINHLLDFDNWRRTHDSTQKLVSTLDAACLIELRLGTRESLVHLDDEQMIGYIKAYWHLVPPQKENYLRILDKIPILEPDSNAEYIPGSQAVQQSYMRLQSYFERVNKSIAIIKDLTGVSYLENKPNKLSVSRLYPFSTIWDLIYDKLKIAAPGWCDCIVADINLRDYIFWPELAAKLQMNASAAVQLFHANHVVLKGLFQILKTARGTRGSTDKRDVKNTTDKNNEKSDRQHRLWQRGSTSHLPPQLPPRTNLAAMDEADVQSEDEHDQSDEDQYADLSALANTEPVVGVCHHWLMGNCTNTACKYPHTIGAAAAHLAKVEAAVKAKSSNAGKLAAMSDNTMAGMRTTATINTTNGNAALSALIDPGSDTYNFIGKEVVDRLGLHIHKTEPILIRLGGTGQTEPTLGTVNLTVCIKEQTAKLEFHVFDTKEDLIIGLPGIRKHFLRPTMELLAQNSDDPLSEIYALDPIATLAALSDDELADQLQQALQNHST
jgi:hypothetical protein